MEFEVITSNDDGNRKVVEVLPQWEYAQEPGETPQTVEFTWIGDQRYTFSDKGKATPKTGAEYKREISHALDNADYPKAPSPTA